MFQVLSTYHIQAWCYAILNISKDYVRNETLYFLSKIVKVIDMTSKKWINQIHAFIFGKIIRFPKDLQKWSFCVWYYYIHISWNFTKRAHLISQGYYLHYCVLLLTCQQKFIDLIIYTWDARYNEICNLNTEHLILIYTLEYYATFEYDIDDKKCTKNISIT